MTELEETIRSTFGDKLRIRVCGIWTDGSKILLVHHQGLGPNGSLWAPPGGGVEPGEDIETSLKREFLEETGTEIKVKEFLFVFEFIKAPFHAIELFFRVEGDATQIKKGIDPELGADHQIITKVDFMDFSSLKESEPENLHHILQQIADLDEIFNLKGYFKSR